MTEKPKWYAWECVGDGGKIAAIGNMDGSWWIDWETVELMAALPLKERDASVVAGIMTFRLLLFSRGSLVEVSRERAEEIAMEYGRKITEREP